MKIADPKVEVRGSDQPAEPYPEPALGTPVPQAGADEQPVAPRTAAEEAQAKRGLATDKKRSGALFDDQQLLVAARKAQDSARQGTGGAQAELRAALRSSGDNLADPEAAAALVSRAARKPAYLSWLLATGERGQLEALGELIRADGQLTTELTDKQRQLLTEAITSHLAEAPNTAAPADDRTELDPAFVEHIRRTQLPAQTEQAIAKALADEPSGVPRMIFDSAGGVSADRAGRTKTWLNDNAKFLQHWGPGFKGTPSQVRRWRVRVATIQTSLGRYMKKHGITPSSAQGKRLLAMAESMIRAAGAVPGSRGAALRNAVNVLNSILVRAAGVGRHRGWSQRLKPAQLAQAIWCVGAFRGHLTNPRARVRYALLFLTIGGSAEIAKFKQNSTKRLMVLMLIKGAMKNTRVPVELRLRRVHTFLALYNRSYHSAAEPKRKNLFARLKRAFALHKGKLAGVTEQQFLQWALQTLANGGGVASLKSRARSLLGLDKIAAKRQADAKAIGAIKKGLEHIAKGVRRRCSPEKLELFARKIHELGGLHTPAGQHLVGVMLGRRPGVPAPPKLYHSKLMEALKMVSTFSNATGAALTLSSGLTAAINIGLSMVVDSLVMLYNLGRAMIRVTQLDSIQYKTYAMIDVMKVMYAQGKLLSWSEVKALLGRQSHFTLGGKAVIDAYYKRAKEFYDKLANMKKQGATYGQIKQYIEAVRWSICRAYGKPGERAENVLLRVLKQRLRLAKKRAVA